MMGCGPGGSCCGSCQGHAVSPPTPPVGMGGFFSTALNVAGSFFGDPALGNQIASQAAPGYVPISQNAQQIATTIAPKVISALKSPPSNPSAIPASAQQIAASVAPTVAVTLANQGYIFPPGSYGAELQSPSMFDAFGGQNKTFVELGFAALGLFMAVKLFRR